MRTQRWTKAAGALAIFAAVAASSSALHAQPAGKAGPKQAGAQPTGPQQAGPQSAAPQPAGPQQTAPQQTGAEPAGPEQAGPITPEASQKSDDLFKRGKDYYKDGKLKEAYGSYHAAWELKKSYDLAANLANTELLIGMKRDAAEHYAYCLRTFAATGGKDRREAAQKKFDEARKEVGALLIKVSPGGAEVLIDGKSVGRAPLKDEVYVDPGGRIVEARLGGYERGKQSVQVEKGAPTQTITLTLSAKKVEAPPDTGTAGQGDPGKGSQGGQPPITQLPPPPPPKKSAALIGAGIGVAAAGLGVGIAGMVASVNNTNNANNLFKQLESRDGTSACKKPSNAATCEQLRNSYVAAGTYRSVEIVGFVITGAAVAATLTYVLLPGARPGRESIKAGVSAEPGGGGLTVLGSF